MAGQICKDLNLSDFGIKDLRVVGIDDIRPNDWNFNSMDDQKFESLLANIERTGYKQLVHVYEDPEAEGKYIIADGEHRWKAMKELGKTEILVMVLALDEAEAMLDTVSSNMIHGEPIALKMAEVLVKLQESFDKAELAMLTGLTEKEIVQHEEMLQMPSDFDDMGDMSEADELPIPITIYMMPGEYKDFSKGIESAIEQMEDSGPKAFYQIGDQMGKMDGALKNAQEVANAKNRAVALEVMGALFTHIQKNDPDLADKICKEVAEKRKKA